MATSDRTWYVLEALLPLLPVERREEMIQRVGQIEEVLFTDEGEANRLLTSLEKDFRPICVVQQALELFEHLIKQLDAFIQTTWERVGNTEETS